MALLWPSQDWAVQVVPVCINTVLFPLPSAARCLKLGQAIGRAVRMVMRNVGGAVPGLMDRATHGQPAKIAFCCAENHPQAPQSWPPLHVEKGFAATSSTVTVMGAEGTLNINTHATDAGELLTVIASD